MCVEGEGEGMTTVFLFSSFFLFFDDDDDAASGALDLLSKMNLIFRTLFFSYFSFFVVSSTVILFAAYPSQRY